MKSRVRNGTAKVTNQLFDVLTLRRHPQAIVSHSSVTLERVNVMILST